MPNGDERNWTRLCFTVSGFRREHGSWPSRVLLGADCIRDIESFLPPEAFRTIRAKVELV
jgi:hypothetical protein